MLAGCSHTPQQHHTFTWSPPPETKKIGRGVACYVNGQYGFPSYSVGDVGRTAVPKLSPEDAAMLRKIIKYVKSKDVRFAQLPTEFIVFIASGGPCGEDYRVLNGACNEIYSPIDSGSSTTASAGSCRNTPRPWMSSDPHGGEVPWKEYYGVR